MYIPWEQRNFQGSNSKHNFVFVRCIDNDPLTKNIDSVSPKHPLRQEDRDGIIPYWPRTAYLWRGGSE